MPAGFSFRNYDKLTAKADDFSIPSPTAVPIPAKTTFYSSFA